MPYIVNRVPDLVAKKFGGYNNVKLSTVKEETGLSYITVSAWMKDQIKRADFPTLAVWCKYLDCTPGDLLEYRSK